MRQGKKSDTKDWGSVLPKGPQVPAAPLSPTEMPSLSAHEISAISSSFISRTKDLEPGMEVKQLSQIKAQFHDRYDTRYLRPAKQWLKQNSRSKSLRNKYLINEAPVPLSSGQMRFDRNDLSKRPLQVGDLVLLKQHTNELSMCVDVPASSADPRYTFATVDGTLKFASRSSILLRIPNELPEDFRKGLLLREKRHDFDPIGTIKNSADETFILPATVRQLITGYLPQQISKTAWDKLPAIMEKLETLHRHLQNFNGPVSIPFLKLVELVQNDESEKIEDPAKLIDALPLSDHIESPVFLATYWAIQSQQKLHFWGEIQVNRALLTPVAVTILPFASQHLYYIDVQERLKSKDYREIYSFTEQVNRQDYEALPERFPHIIKLLRDYASGNFQNNESIISLVAKIFRNLSKYRDSDVSRDCCHELLIDILPEKSFWNPIHYNLTLALPTSSILTKSQETLFEFSTPLKRADPYERHDFNDLRVYCIDSEDAHEIDDGISIREHGNNKYTLYIHIADPTSLFSESGTSDSNGIEDQILRVASKKCFTTYLPDYVAPMLPKSYCKAADLGKNGQKTSTITFSVDVIAPSKGPIEILKESFQIRLGMVSKFPKITYSIADDLLKKAGTSNRDLLTVEQRELQSLHSIAKALREFRVKDMGAVVFGDDFNKGLVQVSRVDQEISFEDREETSSVVLVTEMMILANTLSGNFFHVNNIPGIFRSYQSLILGDQAQSEYESMKMKVRCGNLPTYRDMTLLGSFLNSSFYSKEAYPHEMIGAPQYLTVTSPLRRFPDLVNHMQIHRFIQGLPMCFTQREISKLIDDIQSRDSILKNASRQAASYWTLKYLKNSLLKSQDQSFEVMVTSVPQVGLVRCVLPRFPSARGTLKLNPNETKFPAIGDTVTGCKISKIDCLDGILELEI